MSFVTVARNGELGPHFFEYVEEIPLPRLSVIGRERLTPERPIFVSNIPAKHHDDWFAIERIFAKEMADAVFE